MHPFRLLTLLCALVFVTSGALEAQEPDTLWLRTYGGSGDDWGSSVQVASDGGFVIAGRTMSFGNGWEFYIVKTDSLGELRWSKVHGGPNWDFGESIQETQDGGYIIAGYSGPISAYDVLLLKTDSLGNEEWRATYGGAQLDEGHVVEQTSDLGYMIAGITASEGAGGYDFYLIKTDMFGSVDWTRTYGGAGSDVCFSAQGTSDGGYILVGYTNSYGPGIPNWSNLYMVKTNASGDTMWTRVHGVANQDEVAYSVHQTADNGFVLGGYLHPFGSLAVWAMKTDSMGNYEWDNTYSGSKGVSIKQTSSGEYVFGGYWAQDSTSYDLYILGLDAAGDLLWSRIYGGSSNQIDMTISTALVTDSEFVFTGRTESWGAVGDDVFLMKMGPVQTGIQDEEHSKPSFFITPCSPNPFRDHVSMSYDLTETRTVRVIVYNALGQRIRTIADCVQHAGRHELGWDGRDDSGHDVQDGLYFLKLRADAYETSRSMILIR